MKRTLVALDASPRAPDVLERAIEMARVYGGKLDVFRAVEIPPEIELVGVLEKRAREDLAELVKDAPEELLGSVTVAVGVPWQAICRAAEKVDADLIVIGSHGYSGLERLIGTTAAKVVNHADRSVFVVRERNARGR